MGSPVYLDDVRVADLKFTNTKRVSVVAGVVSRENAGGAAYAMKAMEDARKAAAR